LLVNRERRGGGFLEILSELSEAGIPLCYAGHDPLALRISYTFAHCAGFFGSVKANISRPISAWAWT
jgi:hypothetical protein